MTLHSRTNERSLKPSVQEWLYISLCFALYLSWAAIFTAEKYGPDEYMRIIVPYYIAQNGVIPTGWEPSLINELWGYSYALQMKFPYLIAGVFVRFSFLFSGNEVSMMTAARLVNVLFMTGVAFYAVRITHRVTDSPCRWVFIFLVTLTPQIVFLASYFNLEAYSLFTVFMIVDAWFECTMERWSVKSCIYLGTGIGLCLSGYEYAYSFIVGSFLMFVMWHLKYRKEFKMRQFIFSGVIVLTTFLVIGGWYLIRNAVLFDWDILAIKVQDTSRELYGLDSFKPSIRETPRRMGMSLIGMLRETDWISLTFDSTYGVLGYMDIWLPRFVYKAYDIFMLVGIVSFVVFRKRDRIKDKYMMVFSAFASAIITFGLSIYESWARDYQPQGRYILYAMIPVYMLVTIGYHHLISKGCRLWRMDSHIVGKIFISVTLVFILFTDVYGFNLMFKSFVV